MDNKSLEVIPALFVAVRGQLNMSQAQASEFFGVGADAFTQYEDGSEVPDRPLLLLFRLLHKHPHLWDEVKHTFWYEENAEAIANLNAFLEETGSFSEQYRNF